MFAGIVTIKYKGKKFYYLRFVENYRVRGKQKVIANLGRLDLIRNKLGNLIKSIREFSDEILVTPEEIETKSALEYGQLLVGKKL